MKYVVSDIHGNLEAWNKIMDQIKMGDDDELFVLGDVIDRGAHGIQILRQIMAMPNAHMLLGNHEYMFLNAIGRPLEPEIYAHLNKRATLENYQYNGGQVTLNAFYRLSRKEQEEIVQFLHNIPTNINTMAAGHKFRLVHAAPDELYMTVAKEYPGMGRIEFTVWDRDFTMVMGMLKGFEDTTIIFGHTPTCNLQSTNDKMKVFELNNTLGIDCGAPYGANLGGRLCCVRLDDLQVFYSDEV